VDGPVAAVKRFGAYHKIKMYECTGAIDGDQFEDYVANKDGGIVASQTFATGMDGAHKTSDTLITLGLPWHSASHDQLVARLQRQGAALPNGEMTLVVREFIPVATNVKYDWRRFVTVYQRRTFNDCLLDGKIPDEHRSSEAEDFEAFQFVVAQEAEAVPEAA
jgi:hypothetical protein